MKSKLYFLVILVIYGCSSKGKVIKNITCPGEVTIQYEKIKKSDKGKTFAKKDLKNFMVYFLYDFNDTIQCYVNDNLQYEKFLKLDGSSDKHNDYFGYDYSKEQKNPILKIISKNKKTCFDIEIDKKYKIIYIYIDDKGKWTIRFSNIYYTR
jgi:hypothetical protein